MVNVPVIAKRELGSYFLSPIAYVMLTGFALAHGILFAIGLYPGMPMDGAVISIFGYALFLLIMTAPILTMRLLSEEASRGTIETLMTTPVREVEVVLGKFVGAVLFAVVMFVPILAELIYLRFLGRADVGPMLAGSLGLFLLTSQFIAIGLLCSALTRVQIGAAIACFAIVLGLSLLWLLGRGSTAGLLGVLRYLSPPMHYMEFARGMVDTRHVAYFAITTVTFLFLTVKALELRKWR